MRFFFDARNLAVVLCDARGSIIDVMALGEYATLFSVEDAAAVVIDSREETV